MATPNHGPLTDEDLRAIRAPFGAHPSDNVPCYGCGAAVYVVWNVCRECGRPVCHECWGRGEHWAGGGCRIPAASPEAQAEEWEEPA
jgi:hypothetical protein